MNLCSTYYIREQRFYARAKGGNMQHRDSRSAISGKAALKLDARVSSAHIIQFPGSEYSARQIDDISSCHPADESRRSNAHKGKVATPSAISKQDLAQLSSNRRRNHLVRVAYHHHRWHFVIHADPHFR